MKRRKRVVRKPAAGVVAHVPLTRRRQNGHNQPAADNRLISGLNSKSARTIIR